MTTDEIMNDLHVDESERDSIERARKSSVDYVRGSVDYEVDESEFEKYPIYDSLILALVTQIYFGKELETGLSRGALMLLIQLRARVLGGEANG